MREGGIAEGKRERDIERALQTHASSQCPKADAIDFVFARATLLTFSAALMTSHDVLDDVFVSAGKTSLDDLLDFWLLVHAQDNQS